MSLIQAALRSSRRRPVPAARLLLSTKATWQSEFDMDGVARVSALNMIDPAAMHEPEATMERLRGRSLFSDPYPPGTLLHRLSTLLERCEDGDADAVAELEQVVDRLDSREQLLFYRLREQFMAVRDATLQPSDIPPPASDDGWRLLMADSIKRFQEIGRQMQQVEADKERANSSGAVQSLSFSQPLSSPQDTPSPGKARQPVLPAADQLYSLKTDIDAHTDVDLGRFFDFQPASAALSEGLAGSLPSEYALTKAQKLLVRMTPYRLVSRFRALGQAQGVAPGTTVVLAGGAPGSGRSTALNYVTAWARARPDWLTVFVPDAARFSASGRRIVHSRRHPDLFTQPDLQRQWLQELLQIAAGVLDRVPLQRTPPSPDRRTLHDLVQGAAAVESDPDLIFDVFAELRACTAVPVLVAIDRYNAWMRNASSYADPESRRPLPPSRLALVRSLMDLYDAGPAHGITLAAMTAALPMPSTNELKRWASASEGRREVVTVPMYADAEVDAVMAHWMQSGWLVDIPGDLGAFKQYVRAMSGNSPRELFRVLSCL